MPTYTKLRKSFKPAPAGSRRHLVIEIFERLQTEYGLHTLPRLALIREMNRTGMDDLRLAPMIKEGYLIEIDFDEERIVHPEPMTAGVLYPGRFLS